jgi:PAS domain S-box-containing protein
MRLDRGRQDLERQPTGADQVAPSDRVLLAEIAHREGMLAQAQDLAEQLGSSNEELLLQIEELHAAMEELAAQNSDLRAAQQGIEVESRRYQELFEFLPDAYLATDLAAVIREANRAAAGLLGVRANWLAGKPLNLFVDQQEHQAFYFQLAQLQQGGKRRWETRLVPRGGAPFPVVIEVTPSRDLQGRLNGFLWRLGPVPQRNLAESEFEASEARFRALAETTSAAIFIVQGNKIRYSNPAAKSITGYTPADLLDMDFWELAHPDNRETLRRHGAASQWTDQALARYELKLLTNEGEDRWVDITASDIEFEGKPAQIVTTFDITEQDWAERALRQAHAELELRVQQRTAELAEANEVLQTEIAGHKRIEEQIANIARFPSENPNPVLRLSQAGALLYANEATEALLCDWQCQVGDPAPSFWRDLAVQAFASQAQKTAEIECDGRVYSFVIVPVLSAGYVNLYGRDIADLKQAEQALRQKTLQLKARNKELDAFAHMVAHDLKNPLHIIVSCAEILEQGNTGQTNDEWEYALQGVVQGAYKMNSIIDDLLLLAGVPKMQVKTGPVDMASIVAEAQQRLAPMIQEYRAEVVPPAPSAWPAAAGYAPWIEEVWVNYLSNAIKYGGVPPRVELGGELQADGMVRLWVHDNGYGLAPEAQARLFRPFSRLGQPRAAGNGLGLSIVRRIAKKLGGQVGVESQPGQGSTFYFTLPAVS